MLKKCVNIEKLKIIIGCTDKAYFNKDSYSIKFFNKKKESWIKIPVIYHDIAFEKFINSINKEDYKELMKIVFSVNSYEELNRKYDLYEQLLPEYNLYDYFCNYIEDLRENLLINWCITNNINYKKKKISKIRERYIQNKVEKICGRLIDIEFLDKKKKIYKKFCLKLSKEKKYEKIMSEIGNYDLFEKIIREYELEEEWEIFFFDYYYIKTLEQSRKWGENCVEENRPLNRKIRYLH